MALLTMVGEELEAARHAAGPDEAAVLDALQAGVLVVRDEHIVRANPCAVNILGRSAADVLGRHVSDVLAPMSRLSTGASQPGSERRNEVAVHRPDGSTLTLGFSVSPLDPPGTRSWVVLFQDISAVLSLRNERDRLLRLATLGDVLPSVLHELRNPLAAITGMVEVLVEESDGPLQSDLHALLWELRGMALMLTGIGGVSRPLVGGPNIAVDLVLREACRLLEGQAQRKGVTLSCEVPDLPLLPIDRTAISGIVFNLVANAIDACRPGQKTVVRARVLDDDSFELVVSDNGRGMKPHVLARCCELFFSQRDGGSGIGLALCRETALSAGGTLDVQSAQGVGTTVTVRVPLQGKEGGR